MSDSHSSEIPDLDFDPFGDYYKTKWNSESNSANEDLLPKNIGKNLRDISLDAKYEGKKSSRAAVNDTQEGNEAEYAKYDKKWDSIFKELEYSSDIEDEEDTLDQEERVEEEVSEEEVPEEEEEETLTSTKLISNALEEADSLQKELEEEDQQLQKSLLAIGKKEDHEKALATKNQKLLWDCCLDTRIRLQNPLLAANRLPQLQTYQEFLSTPEIMHITTETSGALERLLVDMVELKSELLSSNPVTASIGEKLKGIESKKRKRGDSGEELDADALWKLLSEAEEQLFSFHGDTIQKWNTRTQLSSQLNKQFKAINQSIMDQVSHILQDHQRLRKRTQLKRTPFHVFGQLKRHASEGDQSTEYDEEIFDDTDFYEQLLKELIESESPDSLQASQRWMEKHRVKRALKKNKGRARPDRSLKYETHDKLVGFMAPKPHGTGEFEWNTEELFGTLFQQ